MSLLVIVQVTLSPLPRTTEPAWAFPLTAPAAPVQLQAPSAYPGTTFSWSDLLPALRPVSVLAVYFSVYATSAAPAPNVSPPPAAVMPKSVTTFAPPLSLTIRLTIVRLAGWSSLVIVQVALS